MGSRTTSTALITVILSAFLSTSVYAGDVIRPLIGMDVVRLCSVKTDLINWSLENTESMSSADMLKYWGVRYSVLHKSDTNLFPHQTKVDGDRLIRDVRRLKHLLQDPIEQEKFFQTETKWCMFYQY